MYSIIFNDITAQDDFNDYFYNDSDVSFTYLPGFNKINILLGSNNCGKSRFMRRFMKSDIIVRIAEEDFIAYNNFAYKTNSDFLQRLGGRPMFALLKIDPEIKSSIDANHNNFARYRHHFSRGNIGIFEKLQENLMTTLTGVKKYYIPTLRSAHSLFQSNNGKIEKIEDDIYIQTYLKNYNIDKNIEIFTGLHLYREILHSRNSEKAIRSRFDEFEKFLSESFFNGKQIDIVAHFDKSDNERGINEKELILIHVEGEKTTRKLYELGDGIQALIILMYKIFMAENNSVIYIDEPELNLHPGMQRLFLEQITGNAKLKEKNLTYVMTTHSNHFLDLTIEKEHVSIYSFSTKNTNSGETQFVIKNVNVGDNEILKNLGVNNSSVFMANCSIWVEGISDRNYIKAFLKSYCNSINKPYPKEDIDFAFFEYAGSNYSHYNFSHEEDALKIKAFALNNKILFISDIDQNKYSKHEELYKLAKENFQYKNTEPFREIENLLTNKVWDKLLIEFRNKKKFKIDVEGNIQNKISKALLKHDHANYNDEYIGVFLKKLNINELNKLWEGSDSKPQTFAHKTELSNLLLEKVNDEIITWNDFKTNSTIVELTEGIYNFITEK